MRINLASNWSMWQITVQDTMLLLRCTDILRETRTIHHCKKNSKWGQWLLHREPWKNQGPAGGITSWTHSFVCKALQLLQVRKHIITGNNWSIHKLISSSISKEQVEEKSKSHNKTYKREKWNKITIVRRSEEDKRQANRQRERECVWETQTEKEKPVQQWNIWAQEGSWVWSRQIWESPKRYWA